ncbi:MAG TPA: YjgP/YjgQ family permease [Armatimonadetes bacterium]|nr:YjgP/YjgQ family permease [Armatimonadota bacterium]
MRWYHTLTTWDRYIVRITIGAFLIGIGIFSGFLVAGELLRRFLELIMEQNAPVGDAFKFFALRMPHLVTMSLPMSMLLAAVVVVGQLSHDNEILALFSSGVSFARLSRAILIVGLLASALAFTFRNYLVPQSDRVAEQILAHLRNRVPPKSNLILRQPPYGPLQQIIVAEHFEPSKGLLKGVQVYFYQDGQPTFVLTAREARWRNGGWEFRDGFWQIISAGRLTWGERFDEITSANWRGLPAPLIQKTPTDMRIEALKLDPDKMTLAELRLKLRYLVLRNAPKLEQLRYLTELHNRFAFAWTCLLMALLGAPLGLRTRQSGLGLALGLSILVVISYYFLWYYGTILARQGHLPILLGCWTPNALTLAGGILLTLHATRP